MTKSQSFLTAAFTASLTFLTALGQTGEGVDEIIPRAPEPVPGAGRFQNIASFQDLRDWAEGATVFGRLIGAITYDGKGKIRIPRTHRLYRTEPWCHIDCDNRHNIIEWNGPLAAANVGTSLLFRNSVPAFGLMPRSNLRQQPKFAYGGIPWQNRRWRPEWFASVHGRMGQNERPSTWWDDGRPDWWWLQAMIDSSPKVGERLNDAEFQLADQGLVIDRPLSLDMRYCQIRGRGRDLPTLYAKWNKTACENYPMKAFFIMQSATSSQGTAGFDSKVLNLTINGGHHPDTAVFWGGTRLEEQMEISGVTVFRCPQYFLWTNGFNGLLVQDCNIAGHGLYDYPTGDVDEEGEAITEQRGSTVILKYPAAVGQGHVRISDIHLNVTKGWFIHHMGNGNMWIRDCDTEGCERLLHQGANNTFVQIENINHFWNDPEVTKPFIYIEKTEPPNTAKTATVIRNVRLMGGYGFHWLHDEQMAEDDSPLLQSLRSDTFWLRHYSRAITLHHLRGYRSHPGPDRRGYEYLPARLFLGTPEKPSRGFVYDLRPY